VINATWSLTPAAGNPDGDRVRERGGGRTRTREGATSTFLVLVNFTDQGIRHVKDTTDGLEAYRSTAKKLGVTLKSAHYLLGDYDLTLTVEGTDEAVATALLKVGSLGNVKTKTLRAFTPEQMRDIVANMG